MKNLMVSERVHALDALVPGAVAHAVYFGHKYARELDEPSGELPYRLDSPVAAVPGRATRD